MLILEETVMATADKYNIKVWDLNAFQSILTFATPKSTNLIFKYGNGLILSASNSTLMIYNYKSGNSFPLLSIRIPDMANIHDVIRCNHHIVLAYKINTYRLHVCYKNKSKIINIPEFVKNLKTLSKNVFVVGCFEKIIIYELNNATGQVLCNEIYTHDFPVSVYYIAKFYKKYFICAPNKEGYPIDIFKINDKNIQHVSKYNLNAKITMCEGTRSGKVIYSTSAENGCLYLMAKCIRREVLGKFPVDNFILFD
jgi:hypothetical protein